MDNLTLLEVAKRLDPDGGTSALAELLHQQNEVLMDMPFIEGNLPTGHRINQRAGLPQVFYRRANRGTPTSSSKAVQIDEATALLEGRGSIDVEVARLNGNTAGFRLQEASGFIEGMNQTMSQTLFYGDSAVDPDKFLGLSTRYSSLAAPNGQNIINAGGASNLTSIWLVGWSPSTVFGIYPKGTTAGLSHKDLGEGDEFDENGNRYRAYMDLYSWHNGLALRDWRYVVRIASINVATLTADAATGSNLLRLMSRALERIQSLSGVTPVFYANRTITSFLRQQIVEKVANSTLTIDQISGAPVMSFGGVPVRRTDALINNETVVS